MLSDIFGFGDRDLLSDGAKLGLDVEHGVLSSTSRPGGLAVAVPCRTRERHIGRHMIASPETAASPTPKTVLFHRNYRGYSGGHGKVFDYYNHVKQAAGWAPVIYLTPDSNRDSPWAGEPVAPQYEPESADVLFLAGTDWRALDRHAGVETRKPVVNFVQGLRHAVAGDPRFEFLSRPATRICVSEEVAAALAATGRCNGPIHVIRAGLDLSELPAPGAKDIDVFIAGLKKPKLALELEARLRARGFLVDCAAAHETRPNFLARMNRARVAVTLPQEIEGLFLPALEGMALGAAVVCPDAVGNRGFCVNDVTCLVPSASLQDLEAAAVALVGDAALRARLGIAGREKVQMFNIDIERRRFMNILESL